MGRIGRWITLAAVLGVLAFLIILLYLLLEPLHRNDDDDTLVAIDITASVPRGTMAWSSPFTTHTPEPIHPAPAISDVNPRRSTTTSSDLAALTPHAADTTRPEREKAQATR